MAAYIDEYLSAAAAAGARLRAPGPADVVGTECEVSFDSGGTKPGGLCISLFTWRALSAAFLPRYYESTAAPVAAYDRLWLQQLSTLVAAYTPVAKAGEEGGNALASAVAASLVETHREHVNTYALVVLPPGATSTSEATFIPLMVGSDGSVTGEGVPDAVGSVVRAMISHSNASAAAANVAPLTEIPIQVSAHALELVQLDNGVRVPPSASAWKCGACELRENLWLNLSDGFIGCGRAQYGGAAGNGHAVKHYQDTGGAFPLCVKLGSITAAGGDVYSYAPEENDEVKDPFLAQHLSHWGIDIMRMEKTEKSMAEMQGDLNADFAFSRVMESDKELVEVSGARFIGAENIGNTCYVNSLLQVLASLQPVQQSYGSENALMQLYTTSKKPTSDLLVQLARVVHFLNDDRYALPARFLNRPKRTAEERAAAPDELTPDAGDACGFIVPRTFKSVAAGGHAEFSTFRQQDAAEFFDWLLEQVDKAAAAAAPRAALSLQRLFGYKTEHRLQDAQSGGVKYTQGNDIMWRLSIPLDAACNAAEVAAAKEAADAAAAAAATASAADGDSESGTASAAKRARIAAPDASVPKLRVTWDAMLGSAAAEARVDDFISPVTHARGAAHKSTRFASFPRILVVTLNRYTMAADWTPVKLDVEVPMPLTLDLSRLRARGGLQPGETPLPDDAPAPVAAAPTPDAGIVAALTDMGFPEGACARAAVASRNAGVEEAAAWLMAHMDDADFAAPYTAPAAAAPAAAAPGVDEGALAMLMEMSAASEARCVAALRAAGGDVSAAMDHIFSHPDEPTPPPPPSASSASSAAGEAAAGDAEEGEDARAEGKYELVGFISHIGRNSHSGHYVAHIRKPAAASPPSSADASGGAEASAAARWYFFNDTHVAESEAPPFDLGYMYFYKRLA